MWPDFGKSFQMSHFTTQIFITKMRNGNFQSTWKWLQCVAPTLNYQKIIGNTWQVLYSFCSGHNKFCNSMYFIETLRLIFQNQVTNIINTAPMCIIPYSYRPSPMNNPSARIFWHQRIASSKPGVLQSYPLCILNCYFHTNYPIEISYSYSWQMFHSKLL